jgi:broad specificity phosphatase PhoE
MIPKDANRRRIFLMRHGSVTYFDANGKPLPPDTAPLNERGIEEAIAAGALFSQHGIRFDRIIVSGLVRTVQTAQHVIAVIGAGVPHEVNPQLVEIKGGHLASIPPDQLQAAFQSAFDGQADESTRFLGGESVGELLDRVIPEVDRLRNDANWDIALMVLHGGVNRAILSYLLTGKRHMLANLAQAPACINAIDLGDAKQDVVLRALNIAPRDMLQTETRKTTMETLYEQYAKYRNRFGEHIDG